MPFPKANAKVTQQWIIYQETTKKSAFHFELLQHIFKSSRLDAASPLPKGLGFLKTGVALLGISYL
jgi:hypothetical protein